MMPDSSASYEESSLHLHQILDRQHNGMVAAVCECPREWQIRSDVIWNFQNMSFPVLTYAQMTDAANAAGFEFLPAQSFFWVEPNYGYSQPGQETMGQTCLMPMSAVDALTRWIAPKFCRLQNNGRITAAGPMPQLAQSLGADLKGLPEESAGVRLEYAENGRAFEEEIYGVKVAQAVPYTGPMGTMIQTNWGFARLFRFRAEQGTMDARREMFWRIARSWRFNPAWEQLCAQIMQQLQVQFDQYIQMGYSQIQAAGQLSRAISANNDAMLHAFEQQRQAAQHSAATSRNAASDRSPNDAFSDYIRGVETVSDPYYGESQQDANYQYHWTDGSGSYRQSNDPFFNPNIGATQNWTLMEPKKT